jgi:hypothetical protein
MVFVDILDIWIAICFAMVRYYQKKVVMNNHNSPEATKAPIFIYPLQFGMIL